VPVTVVRDWFVSALVIVTVTFGTRPPEESVIVPVSAAVPADCPHRLPAPSIENTVSVAANAARFKAKRHTRSDFLRVMSSPL
jgi:hypothetical protein